MTSKVERRWALWLGAAIMLLATLPYLAGYFVQTADWRYSGLVLAEEDGYSYLAKMLWGAGGAWLFKTPYTLAPQNGFLGFLPYLLLGKLTAPPGQYVQLVALFHLFRIAGGILVCLATYDFVSIFLERVAWRRLATLIAMLGGGLGWLSVLGLGGLWQGPMPLEFYSPETFGFLGILAIPHLAWARALLLWGLRDYLVKPGRAGWLCAGLAWIAAGLFQPLIVVVGWAVLGAHLLGLFIWSRISRPGGQVVWVDWLKRAVLLGVVSAPVVLYNFLSFELDPFLSVWQRQNYLPSPPITDYMLAYGILLPFAVLGAMALARSMNARSILPLAWVCVFPVLAYLPYNLQRRLPEGLWVALAILAVLGWGETKGRWRGLAVVWLGTGFLPALLLMGVAFRSATILAPPSFQPAAEIRAFGYFATQALDRPAVAAALDTSTVLPAFASVRVPIGHGPESLAGDRLRPEVESIYSSNTPDAQRIVVLEELKINYVFWGPSERKLGNFDPASAGYLTRVYESGGYSIYQVEPGFGK